MVPIDEECIKIFQVLKIEQEKANKELGIKNRYKIDFSAFMDIITWYQTLQVSIKL